jgi:hypothetical protein
MRELLKSQISEHAFAECWTGTTPPYDAFLDLAGERLSAQIVAPVTQFTGAIRSWGDNRVRIDGDLRDAGGDKTYYLELVWLPRSNSYRGNANVRDSIPPPEPKTVDQFIAALDAIQNDEEIIFEGQVYQAAAGVDEADPNLHQAFPAFFRLFERFPEEDFGAPGILVHLMEARDGYDGLLTESLKRIPSLPTVTMVNRILNSPLTADQRGEWLRILQAVSDSDSCVAAVRDYAEEFLNYQAALTNTEQDGAGQPATRSESK